MAPGAKPRAPTYYVAEEPKGSDNVETNYNFENLAQVWDRIGPDIPQTNETADDDMQDILTLRRFIDGEASDAQTYSRLAKRTKGTDAEHIFSRIAADERRHAKRLITEHFILSGDTYSPNIEITEEPSLLAAVRQRYIEERKGAVAYTAAANETKNPRLSAVYSEFAQDESRHAVAMLAMIERMMA